MDDLAAVEYELMEEESRSKRALPAHIVLSSSDTGALPSHQESVQNRCLSFLAGAMLIAQTYENKDAVDELEHLKQVIASGQIVPLDLDEIVGVMAYCLAQHIEPFNYGSAHDALLGAENLACWKERPTQATHYTDSDGHTIVQLSIPITTLTPELAKEYLRIFDSDNLPSWFSTLPDWEQIHFQQFIRQELIRNHYNVDLIDRKNPDTEVIEILSHALSGIPATIRRYPGLANASRHVLAIYDDTGARIFVQERVRSGIITPHKMKDKKEALRTTQQSIEQLVQDRIEEQVRGCISKFRLKPDMIYPLAIPLLAQTLLSPLPGVAGSIAAMFDDDKGMIMAKDQALSQSWPALITAVSDIRTRPGLQGFNLQPEIISTNHAFNKFRRVAESGANAENQAVLMRSFGKLLFNLATSHNVDTSQAFFRQVNDIASCQNIQDLNLSDISEILDKLKTQLPEDLPLDLLFEAVKDYLRLAQDDSFEHRSSANLFRASLEQIIVGELSGIPYGSCKSGKDRKGIEICHTDAMIIYYKKYGELPKYDVAEKDTDKRKNFLGVFARHFVSNHHAKNADYNAIGSYGVKSIKGVLPQDMQDAIDLECELSLQDKNASLNRPGKVFSWTAKSTYAKLLTVVPNPLRSSHSRLSQSLMSSEDSLMRLPVTVASVHASPSADGIQGISVTQLTKLFRGFIQPSPELSLIGDLRTLPREHGIGGFVANVQNTITRTSVAMQVRTDKVTLDHYDESAMILAIKMLFKTVGVEAELNFKGVPAEQQQHIIEISEQIRQEFTHAAAVEEQSVEDSVSVSVPNF